MCNPSMVKISNGTIQQGDIFYIPIDGGRVVKTFISQFCFNGCWIMRTQYANDSLGQGVKVDLVVMISCIAITSSNEGDQIINDCISPLVAKMHKTTENFGTVLQIMILQ